MEKLFILCFAVVAVLGQDAVITFDDPSDRFYEVGQQDVITFSINQGIIVMYQAKLFGVSINDRNEERVLFQGLNLIDAEPSNYAVTSDPSPNNDAVSYTFTINEVRDIDEGKFVLRFYAKDTDTSGAPDAQAEFQINILRAIESVSLKFDTVQEVTTTQQNPLEVDSGTYPVQCTARGSNPAVSNLKMYLHNTPIDAEVMTEKMETEQRRFKATVKANVEIKAMDSLQSLECVASEPDELEAVQGAQPVTVAVPIKVNKYDPEITCNETRAYPGMMYPKLTCTVQHSGLDIKDFRYKIKKTGEEITVDQMGTNNERVEVTPVSGDQTKVVLDLYNAKDWHFDTEFFLVVENQNGYLTQFPVKLTRIAGGNGNTAAFVTTSMTAILLSVILGTSLRLQ